LFVWTKQSRPLSCAYNGVILDASLPDCIESFVNFEVCHYRRLNVYYLYQRVSCRVEEERFNAVWDRGSLGSINRDRVSR